MGIESPLPLGQLLTVPEFARRVGIPRARAYYLVRRGLLFGARRTATGRWRISAEAVAPFLRGAQPMPAGDPGLTARAQLQRLWLHYEGAPWEQQG